MALLIGNMFSISILFVGSVVAVDTTAAAAAAAAAQPPTPAVVQFTTTVFTHNDPGGLNQTCGGLKPGVFEQPNCYRIPMLARASAGGANVLAFAEARYWIGDGCVPAKQTGTHCDNTAVVYKRSSDGGRSFGPMQSLGKNLSRTGPGDFAVLSACGATGPCVIRVQFCFDTNNSQSLSEVSQDYCEVSPTGAVHEVVSHDGGDTWEPPRDILLVHPNLTRGSGVQTMSGVQLLSAARGRKGRLLWCGHKAHPGGTYVGDAWVWASDDDGRTYFVKAWLPFLSECTLAESSTGVIILNSRNEKPGAKERVRLVVTSSDGGDTWSNVTRDSRFPTPGCQASLLGLPLQKKLYFSNPASNLTRTRLTVRRSEDDAVTFPASVLVNDGESGYSSLGVIQRGGRAQEWGPGEPGAVQQIGILYETGDEGCKGASCKIVLAGLSPGF